MAEVNDNSSIQLFEDQKIRTAWDAEKEEWYFAIVDVIAVLTDSADPQNYWRVLKKRLKDEGNETITNCNGLKMTAPDGKKRKTDVANTEQLLRIIQSIPSQKAEPFKAWLAMVCCEQFFCRKSCYHTADSFFYQFLTKFGPRDCIDVSRI